MPVIPTVPFGPNGPHVTRIGLGGEGVLRTRNRDTEARNVIGEALSRKITYFDTAPAYENSQSYLGSVWAERLDLRNTVFQTSKSAQRTAEQATTELQKTLDLLHTDHLDLWQIHDLRTWEEVRQIEGTDGALTAFVQAKEKGLVRHIGVTGHHDPEVLTHAVAHWPLDAVLLPVNPAETVLGGFLDDVASQAKARNMAVIGMKCLGGGLFIQPEKGVTADILIRYALNGPVDLIIVGCSSPEQVREAVTVATDAGGMDTEASQLESAFRPNAPRLAYYRGRV